MHSDLVRSLAVTPASASRAPAVRMWRRWVAFAVTVAAVTLALVLLRRSLPDPGIVLEMLTAARWWWLALAVLFEVGSVVMYALQQRRLLTALGGAMSRSRAVGLSLARTTLSTAMPAGGAVSTTFAVRQFLAHGATNAAALATAALTSLQASAAVVLVYLGWIAVAGLDRLDTADLPLLAVALAVLCVTVVLAGRRTLVSRNVTVLTAPVEPRPHADEQHTAGSSGRWRRLIVAFGWDTTRACVSLPRRDWVFSAGAAVARRMFDLACLAAVAAAYRLDTGIVAMIGAYLAGLLVRQILSSPAAPAWSRQACWHPWWPSAPTAQQPPRSSWSTACCPAGWSHSPAYRPCSPSAPPGPARPEALAYVPKRV
ncbi:lysylphosphatidylglycerol synthase domain-containing protein [Dactylosporangium darangshiense]|uniref:lysylphosphatidylglycerol synthase domain-containing protein n=1 Tax=Dactylosporangium darangshiense TaxID=579108 RepID=UPI00362700BA